MLLLEPQSDLSAWSIGSEVEAMASVAHAGKTFDLVGFSGGAAVCLAFAATHLERIGSLTLIEPPWIGNDPWSNEEVAFAAAFDRLTGGDALTCYTGFFDLFAPGVAAPAVGDPAALERAAETLRVVWRGYRGTSLDREAFSQFQGPVLLPFGDRSSSRMAKQARVLSGMFPNARVLEIEDAHHFNILTVGAPTIAEGIATLHR